MENSVANRLTRLKADIEDMKSTQPMSGDSWVVYRASVDFLKDGDKLYLAEFTPDTSGPFVARPYIARLDRKVSGIDRDIMPDPEFYGKWWISNQFFGAVTVTLFIYSTKKGNITIEEVPVV